MTTLEKLTERHKEAFKKLRKESGPVCEKLGANKAAAIVAYHLDVSSQTVVNYLTAPGKDGFLTEAMTEEFKRIKDEDSRFYQLHISSKIPERYIVKIA